MKNNKYEIDMCNGPIMPALIKFFVPLMTSGILQLLFNAVDLIVVGRFAGNAPLAAVGSTIALINLFINLFMGISIGANVCAARYHAEENDEKMSAVVHTSILYALITGLIMTVIGRIIAVPALKLMDTPADIINLSVKYMQIYFIGSPFFMVYNFGAAILRAVGDTKRPMIFLVISGFINAVLNIIFVVVFKMDVDGVATATVISQITSCIPVIIVLKKSPESYRLHFSKLRIDFKILGKIVKIGLPAGVQSVVINFSNVLLQSSVNSFGKDAMAGYTAANNIFGFLFTSVNSISQACISFTSQNTGANKPDRVKRVLKDCLILETTVGLALGAIAYFLDKQVLGIYSSSPSVIAYGAEVLALTTLTYFICGYMDCIPGALRGMGYSTIPMILSIVGTVGMRVLWIFFVFPYNRTIRFLFISYPVSWIFTFILQAICCIFIYRKKGMLKLNKKNL